MMRAALPMALAGLAAAAPPPTGGPMFEYSWQQGSLAPGGDIAPAAEHTLSTAEALCTTLPLCSGFTYVGSNSSKGARLTHFKSGGWPNASDASWSTWAKFGIQTLPALTTVVGRSNLTLSLRQSAFT